MYELSIKINNEKLSLLWVVVFGSCVDANRGEEETYC